MAAKGAFLKAKSSNVFGQARKLAKMLRAGLYARVSTNDQQTLGMQNQAMREYAARRGWTIALQVREVISGAARREAREKLIDAARRREIDVVLVWRLDRWGRSVTDLLATLQELEHLGVGFVSLTEALDLASILHGPCGQGRRTRRTLSWCTGKREQYIMTFPLPG
jgi:predicted site-specific integrase-resolvase